MKLLDLKDTLWDERLADFTARFWSKVRKTEACWEWIGPTSPASPYGQIQLPGMRRSMRAHRASWLLAFGEIQECLVVLHRCDNPKCVRVEHLALGTQADNVRDMHEKGRARVAKGDDHGFAKLSSELVKELRARYAVGGVSIRQLAKQRGMSYSGMRQALNGTTWKESPIH